MQLTRGVTSCLFSTVLSAVVFPEEQTRDKRQEEVEPILPCPDGQHFCDNITDYPTNINILDSVVASRLIKNAIFDPKPTGDIQQRTSFIKESRACDNRKGTVYPKKAKNIEGEFVFIVNDDQYRQAVEIEQCLGEGEVCLTDSDAPLPTTVCRQKFATYRMYVINQEGRQVYDSFSLPSACLCHHKSDLAIKNGFNLNVDYPQLICPAQEDLMITNQPTESSTTDKSKPQKSSKPPRKNNSKIHFSDRKKREAELPSGCRNGSEKYCDEKETDDYPTEAVLEALADNNEINPQLFSQLFDSNCKDLKTRFFDIDEEQLCSGIPKLIFPRQAKNLKDEWRYIVNIENYTQSVEIEECFNPDIPVDDFESSNVSNSSVLFDSEESVEEFGSCHYSGSPGNNPQLTVCRQLFTAHKLLSLSTEGQLVVDSFELPSACACYFKEDFILTFRRDMNATNEEDEVEDEIEVEVQDDGKEDSSMISFSFN